MNRIEVNVSGPTQSGKSIVLAAVESALKSIGVRFTLSEDLEAERKLSNPDQPEQWEMDLLTGSAYVVLSETNIPRNG